MPLKVYEKGELSWTTSYDPGETYKRGYASHECVGKNGATVREASALDSAALGLVPRSAVVVVEEERDVGGVVRCRLAAPHSGWCSAKVLTRMLTLKRRAVVPTTSWAADAWARFAVDVEGVDAQGRRSGVGATHAATVALPRGHGRGAPRARHRWPVFAVFAAGAGGDAADSPLFARLAETLQRERHVPAIFLGEGRGTNQDALRGAVKYALRRADEILLIGAGAGAALLPAVAHGIKPTRRRVRAAVCVDCAVDAPNVADATVTRVDSLPSARL